MAKPPPIKKPRKQTPKNDLESAVQREGMALLRKMNIPCWRQNSGKVHIGAYYIQLAPPGAADVTGILPDGRRLECEAKRRYEGTQSNDQKAFQRMVEARGGVYILFHSAVELRDKLKKHLT